MSNIIPEYHTLTDIDKTVLFFHTLLDGNYYNYINVLRDALNAANSKTLGYRFFDYSQVDSSLKTLRSKKILDYKNRLKQGLKHGIVKNYLELHGQNINFKSPYLAAQADHLVIAIYLNDLESFLKLIQHIDFSSDPLTRLECAAIEIPLDLPWLEALHPTIKKYVVAAMIASSRVLSFPELVTSYSMLNIIIEGSKPGAYVKSIMIRFCFAQGKLEEIKQLTMDEPHYLQAVYSFLNNNHELALLQFTQSLKEFRKLQHKRNIYLPGFCGLIHTLATLQSQDPDQKKELANQLQCYIKNAEAYAKERKDSHSEKKLAYYFEEDFDFAMCSLSEFHKFSEMKSKTVEMLLYKAHTHFNTILSDIVTLMVYVWANQWNDEVDNHCDELITMCSTHFPGYHSILLDIKNKALLLQDNHKKYFDVDFVNLVKTKPKWDRAITGLELALKVNNPESEGIINRLIWEIDTRRTYVIEINAYEQKYGRTGWTSGRNISIAKLKDNPGEYLTIHDKAVINATGMSYYTVQIGQALVALIGHPLVFDYNRNHIEVSQAKPSLLVKETKGGYHISLSHQTDATEIKLIKETTHKYKVLKMDDDYVKISQIIGSGLLVPKEAKDRILGLVQRNIPSIDICAELDPSDLPVHPADSNVIIQLIPMDNGEDGMRIEAIVKPWGDKLSGFAPALGPKSNVMQKDGSYISMVRDFTEEQKKLSGMQASCPSFKPNKESIWKTGSLEGSLEALYELQNYQISQQNNDVTIEWPKGKSLSINRNLSFENLKMNIKKDNQWFAFDGSIELDQDQVVSIKQLLQLVNQSNGRFIKLDNERFVALTDSFLRRLQELQVIASDDDKIHPLASQILLEFAEKSASLEVDKAWISHINALKLAEIHIPQVPASLKAVLRHYQVEGFNFLSNLANMKLGACLADDMGLGKTVQTIALLLEIIEKKQDTLPSLVIAPASVCHVWSQELAKFAPSINAHKLESGDRAEMIEKLGNDDVLICSYAILYQIEDLIKDKEWKIIVLDEAQAIKNYYTKRFKIISKLKSKYRVALSGTPVENHIEELWNLFEFLNPGFLGSRESFQVKYAKPIQQDRNQIVNSALKQLIQPFILRRLKSKVLEELPAKIEQTIVITPSDEEKHFMEALRQESLERIEAVTKIDGTRTAFSILTELTKLRRACCDASLVTKDNMPIVTKNSKLDVFEDILDSLIDNNHKSLVFSQYVDYLSIVRARLDAKKISYQYLDGSTPQAKRQKIVADFQAGQGDVFLISLKAGGVGLNLTAADYVIHLDPWWNPAVEDQASDRAHRIGQTKTVTVYRLVMENSIEEKIIKLHEHKRDMAVSLLSDTDKSVNLTADELMQLLISK